MWALSRQWVEPARIDALTAEAFALVFEAHGWAWDDGRLVRRGAYVDPAELVRENHGAAIDLLAREHHNGATFDAFVEVERVQALLSAVEAAERGEWDGFGGADGMAGPHVARITQGGMVRVDRWREPCVPMMCFAGPLEEQRAYVAREARAQLPRLVRIICGVEQP